MRRAVWCWLLSLVAACTSREHRTTAVYVFVDVTDSLFRHAATYRGDLDQILKLMSVDTLRGGPDGGEVRVFLISDLSESKARSRQLAPGVTGLLGQNPLDRLDEVRAFARGLSQDASTLFDSVQWERRQSKIYQNLCRELPRLATTKATRRVAIVYSDLLENSRLLTFYGSGPEAMRARQRDTAAIERMLADDCRLPDLRGVEIHVVTLRTAITDEAVNVAVDFWRSLLERKGASVSVGPALRP